MYINGRLARVFGIGRKFRNVDVNEAPLKVQEIKELFFKEENLLEVVASMKSIPLVAANISKSSHSFTEGQLLYIFGGYWGVGERVKVVGRFRRKNRIIKGACPIKNLVNHRLKVIYNPAIIRKLEGQYINFGLFVGFERSCITK